MVRLVDRLSMLQSAVIGVVTAALVGSALPGYLGLVAARAPESVRAWEVRHAGDGNDRLVVALDLSQVKVSVVDARAARPASRAAWRGAAAARPAAAPKPRPATRPATRAVTRADRMRAALAALERVHGVRFAVAGDGDQALVTARRGTDLKVVPFVREVRTEATGRTLGVSTLPDDPYLTHAWALRNDGNGNGLGLPGARGADLDITRAWERTRGAGAVIAVVDTGVDLSQPDLAGRIWTNPREVCGATSDTDGDGLIGDCHGWNFYLGSPDVSNVVRGTKASSHGTAVAGAAAAVVGNATGAGGVAPEATIMPLVVGYDSTVMISVAARAVRYAVDHGADVINMSFGGLRQTPVADDLALRDAIRYAASHDVLVVAAAGNDSRNRDVVHMYPANFSEPNLLVVGASAPDDSMSSFSAYGPATVDLFAPGSYVVTTGLGSLTVATSGTSIASPLVAATAALMRSASPTTSYATVRQRLLAAADPVDAFLDRSVSGGRLDAGAAVGAVPDPVSVTFTGWGALTPDAPATASLTLEGSGDGLPAGDLALRLDLLARADGRTFTVAGARLDAGPSGVVTTDAAGVAVLHPAALTGAALAGGISVPLAFSLPAGRYAVAVRLTSGGAVVSAPEFGVFDVGGSATPEDPGPTTTTRASTSTTAGTSAPGTAPSGTSPSSSSPSRTTTAGTTTAGTTTAATTTMTTTASTTASTSTRSSSTSSTGGEAPSSTASSVSPVSSSAGPTVPAPETPTGDAPAPRTSTDGGGATGGPTPGSDGPGPESPSAPPSTGPGVEYPGGTPMWGITAVSPVTGSVTGGGRVTVLGTDLPTNAAVQFGSTEARIVSRSTTSIVAEIPPAGAPGRVDVTVWSTDYASEILAGVFTYTPAPTSGGGSAEGSGGGPVTGPTTDPAAPPTGSGDPGGGGPDGGGPVDGPGPTGRGGPTGSGGPTSADGGGGGGSTTTSAQAPTSAPPAPTSERPSASSSVPATGPTTSSPRGWRGVVDAAHPSRNWAITSITPSSGTTDGSGVVTITGARLPDNASVLFDTSPAYVVYQGGNTLVAIAPRVIRPGPVDVVVRARDGRYDALAEAFTYEAEPTATWSSTSSAGPRTGSSTTAPSTAPTTGQTGAAPTSTAPSHSAPTGPGPSHPEPISASTTAPDPAPGAGSSGGGSGGGPGGSGGSAGSVTLNEAGPGAPALPGWVWSQPPCSATCRAVQG